MADGTCSVWPVVSLSIGALDRLAAAPCACWGPETGRLPPVGSLPVDGGRLESGRLDDAGGGRVLGGREAVSLGHTRSLVYLLATEDLAERPGSPFALSGAALGAYRELAGDGIFRLSVGIEDPDDIIDDLRRVLT